MRDHAERVPPCAEMFGYIAFLFLLAGLCGEIPAIGYPLSLIFVIRLIFSGKLSSSEVPVDTVPPPDFHHH